MQGGTVIVAASPYTIDLRGKLSMTAKKTGLEDWLKHNGLVLEQQMVLDPQNTPFPVPVQRNLGGFMIQETQLVNYPYFVDIRSDGMHQESGITSGLQQVTMNWPSPITVDPEKNKGRHVTRLLESSAKSWVTASTVLQPDFQTYKELGFAVEGDQKHHLVAAVVEGGFTSYFTGKPSPLLKKDENDEKTEQAAQQEEQEDKEKEEQVIARQLDKSPDTSRIILFASSSFLSDTVLNISSSVNRTSYLGPVQLMANTVDWSLEDRGLLSIRGRSHFSRPLHPITKDEQLFWEYLNYAFVLFGLIIIWLFRLCIRKQAEKRQLAFLQFDQSEQSETGRVSS
jgi:ABC-2 type transport system permease protein